MSLKLEKILHKFVIYLGFAAKFPDNKRERNN